MAETGERVTKNPDTAFEATDWPIRTIALVLFGIVVFVALMPLVIMAGYPSSVSDVSRRVRVEPPKPQLEVNPPQDLANFEVAERRRRDTYYWIDKDKGVVHIPVEQAMRMLAEKGIDGFPKAAR